MNEHSKHDTLPGSPQGEPDVAASLKKIQQQLSFLEKKVDILIGQSSERPFQRRTFSKPFRPFNRSHHHGRGDRENPREGGFAGPRHFDKPQGGENRGFDHKKKPFFRKRKEHS